MVTRIGWLVLALGVGTLFAGSWLSRSNGSRQPDATAAEQAVRSFEKAIRDSNVEELQALTTSQYFERYLSLAATVRVTSSEDQVLALGQRLHHQIESITLSGDTAVVLGSLQGSDAQDLDAVQLNLVRQNGDWLVDSTPMRKTRPSGGSLLVELTMDDFSFGPRPLVIRRGRPLVIRARNDGAQPHMIAVWRVPPHQELIKLIEATDGMPTGVERVVNSRVFDIGDEGDLTVKEGLKRGRYMLTCFLNDVTSHLLVPHYDLGMLTEFEVE